MELLHSHIVDQLRRKEWQFDGQKNKRDTQGMCEIWTTNVKKGITNYFKEKEVCMKGNKGRGHTHFYEQENYDRWKEPRVKDVGHLKTESAIKTI